MSDDAVSRPRIGRGTSHPGLPAVTTSIVIPVYNGERTIRPLVMRLVDSLDADALQVVLVDDGSADGSDQEAVRMLRNYGETAKDDNRREGFNSRLGIGRVEGGGRGLRVAQERARDGHPLLLTSG